MTLCDWNEDGGDIVYDHVRKETELNPDQLQRGLWTKKNERRVFTVYREGCDLSVAYYNFTWSHTCTQTQSSLACF